MIIDDFLVDFVCMIQVISNSLHSFLQSIVSILVALIKANFYSCKLLLKLIHHLFLIQLFSFFALRYILEVFHVSLELIIRVVNCFFCLLLVVFDCIFFLLNLFFPERSLEIFFIELLLLVCVVYTLVLFLHFFLDVCSVLLNEDSSLFIFQ